MPEEIIRFPSGDGGISALDDDNGDNGTNDEAAELNLTDSWKLLLLKGAADGQVWEFNSPDSLQEFFHEWGYYFKKTVGKEGNILHRLLLHCEEGDIDKMGHLRDAVITIVQNHPFLLWQRRMKHDDESPLWLAIKQKEAAMVIAFMEGLKRSNQSQASELKSLLKEPVDPERRSMLQWAIEKNLGEDAIQAMLTHVSDDTLLVQDINGHTALHSILTYGDCTTDRVRTIQQMLLQSRSALGMVDKLGHSIYAHHLWAQKQWLGQKRLLEAKAEKEENVKSSDLDPKCVSKIEMGPTPSDDNIDPRKVTLDNQTDASAKVQGPRDWIAPSQNEKEEREVAEQKGKAQSRRRKRRNAEENAQAAEQNKKRKDEQERAKAREEAKRHPEILEANSQTVQLEIKLRCMRTLSPKETARILYGNTEDRRICFDFPGRSTVRFEAFKMGFQSVKFDEVLQYVALPSVRFEKKNSNEEMSSKMGHGRKDIITIFEWLRKAKKVKRIVKVIVNDFEKPSHSDRAIVESLKGLHVEELQWLKTDLDPETILNVSEDIRQLRLRWSGSNTALRAWSDPCGLRKLQHLDTIQLDLEGDEVLESFADTLENVIKFETRMNIPINTRIDENKLTASDISTSRWITVKVPAMKTFGRPATITTLPDIGTKLTHIENHKWLDTMDTFGEEMIPVWKEAQKRAMKDSSKEPFSQPVTVALIDDGVDVLDPSLQGRLIDGKTLSYDIPLGSEPTEQREHAFWESSEGRGTVMANMIFRVCPMAKLYAIRIETHVDRENRSRVNARNAAEAINAAVDRGVNIISMSWTIGQDEDSIQSGLQKAIDRAFENNILMFASSGDGGHFMDDSWPVSLKRDAFFRIGAAKADGKPSDWAGPLDLLDYTFPGVDVIKAHYRSLQKSGSEYHDKLEQIATETGSSVATALAAGTAAMVLTCVRIAAIDSLEKKRGVTRHVLNKMQKRNNMAVALERLGVKLGDNKFIEVWQTLDTRDWPNFKEKRPAGKMEMVATKTIPLIPSQVMGS
ncbi:peptidase S8/S53 domain-containing protein [Xylaria cf. heliscus]|nr:peptidase S8/S53 domain-containing protein [Xylaria cf. heliscus]